jgi:dephospho-CoA kinase
MVVIPLLYETNAEASFDKIICVACSPEGQRERLCGRGWPVDQIHGRIAAQLPVGQKLSCSHYVVWTEGSLANHRRQVESIVKKLMV